MFWPEQLFSLTTVAPLTWFPVWRGGIIIQIMSAYMCASECVAWVANSQDPDRSPQTQKGLQTLEAFSHKVCIPVQVWLCVCVCSLKRNPNQHMKGVYLSVASPAALTVNRHWLRCLVPPSSHTELDFKHAAKFKTEMQLKWGTKGPVLCHYLYSVPMIAHFCSKILHDWKQFLKVLHLF